MKISKLEGKGENIKTMDSTFQLLDLIKQEFTRQNNSDSEIGNYSLMEFSGNVYNCCRKLFYFIAAKVRHFKT